MGRCAAGGQRRLFYVPIVVQLGRGRVVKAAVLFLLMNVLWACTGGVALMVACRIEGGGWELCFDNKFLTHLAGSEEVVSPILVERVV